MLLKLPYPSGKGIFKPGAKFVEGTWSNGHGTLLIHNNLPLKGLFRDGKFVDTNKLTKTSNSKIEEYKNFCSEIGFTPGTEKFGECVVEAMKKG